MYFRDISNDTYFEYYTIDKGDTLYKIGKMYNVNPSLLASMNGFDVNDYIYPGQVLLIPNKNYSYYVTKEGDTLESVANTFKTSQSKLIDDNKTIYLMDGQMIVYKNNRE